MEEWAGVRRRRREEERIFPTGSPQYNCSLSKPPYNVVARHMVPFKYAKVFIFCLPALNKKFFPSFPMHEKEHKPILLMDPFQKEGTKSHDTFWFFLAWPGASGHLTLHSQPL